MANRAKAVLLRGPIAGGEGIEPPTAVLETAVIPFN